MEDALPRVPFAAAIRVWARVAALSFGGPAGQIAVMQRILVDEKRWVSQERFLHALNYCMLLPGPEAQQLTIYLGWLLNGTAVGILAGALFVLPGFLAILALSLLYVGFQDSLVVAGMLYGLKPAVLAVVVEALVRIGRRALGSPARVAIAAGAFVAIFFFDVPFPAIVLGAAAIGWWLGRRAPAPPAPAAATSATGTTSAGAPSTAPVPAATPPPGDGAATSPQPRWRRSAGVVLVWLAVWWLPVGAAALALGSDHVVVAEAVFFSKTAVVTFGGAYAVLAYVGQRAVHDFGWLSADEMLDGLGLAETTPGPLIMVLQFVGFLGAHRAPGALPPLLSAVLGAAMTTWVTFSPSFLFILLGAPYVEALRGRRGLAGALAGITAAVVGVILNLAVWFGLHVMFGEVREVAGGIGRLWLPTWHTIDPLAVLIAAAAFWALFRARAGMLPTLAGAVVLGALVQWLLR